jgi:hypothetical protein
MTCGMLLDLEWEALGRSVRTRDLEASVHVRDAVAIAVRMLPVLQGGAMGAALREVLAEQGWAAQPDGTMTRGFGGVLATLDAEAATVTVSRSAEATVTATGRATATAGDESDEKRAAATAGEIAERLLAQRRTAATARLEAENVAVITREEPSVRAALQEALNRVYRRALEQRARELGEVESIDERGDVRGGYEVTVVVKA